MTLKMLEQSLRDLNREYIDLYMIHWPDEKIDIRYPMEVLSKAKKEGKIRYIGLCNTTCDDVLKSSEIDEIEFIQAQLNFFERDNLKEIIPLCIKKNIDFLSWGTLDKGILTERVHPKRTFDEFDCRSWAPWWKQIDKESRYKKLKKIKIFLEKREYSLLQLAISYNLSIEGVSMLLCGARNFKQMTEILDTFNNLIPNEILLELDQFLNAY